MSKREREDDESLPASAEDMDVDTPESEEAPKPVAKAKRVKKETAKVKEEKSSEKQAMTKKALETKKGPSAAKKAPAIVKVEKASAVKKKKELTNLERLEETRKATKWWEIEELPEGINWKTLEQPGILFPETYEVHGKPLIYDGTPIVLPSEQEEIASFYAAVPDDGPQLGGPSRATFQKNFFNDFKAALGEGSVITDFEKCDFSVIREHLNLKKSLRKAATQEEKAAAKAIKDKNSESKGYSIVDGRLEKMGNFTMEPPGLFLGRGEHPLTGTYKRRTFSNQVKLNMSCEAAVPICDLPGRAWKEVQHDPAVTWLCSWNENVQDSNKYVMLSASSSFKGKSDRDKYGKAIELLHCIDKVRKDYKSKIASSDKTDRQLGVAMWVIDVLALRVGGEKGEDEADTVGCCSLRLEHLHFNSTAGSYEIELEFLGKDSMVFKQNINFAKIEHPSGDVGKEVYNCLKTFVSGKKDSDQVFDTLDPSSLNKHLSSLMKGLSAKVFRTFNASITLEKELPGEEELNGKTIAEKVTLYNDANRLVAILCNHQKTVSKAQEAQFENLYAKLDTLKEQLEKLIEWKALIGKKQANKIPLKPDDTKQVEALSAAVLKAQHMKDTAVSNEQKLAAVAAMDTAKANVKQDGLRKASVSHMWKTTPNETSVNGRIETWNEKIAKFEIDIKGREDNKEVALGTSKINYMDPRISVAWCKRHEVPIDKIFAKTLRDKFNWAMAVEPKWKFI
jgi:DNA topoisomerase I